MTTTRLTPTQLRTRGYAVLLRELGPIDFIRFVQQCEPGEGDYTRDRGEWLDRISPEQINELIDENRQRVK
jgi:hypothetical protein